MHKIKVPGFQTKSNNNNNNNKCFKQSYQQSSLHVQRMQKVKQSSKELLLYNEQLNKEKKIINDNDDFELL